MTQELHNLLNSFLLKCIFIRYIFQLFQKDLEIEPTLNAKLFKWPKIAVTSEVLKGLFWCSKWIPCSHVDVAFVGESE